MRVTPEGRLLRHRAITAVVVLAVIAAFLYVVIAFVAPVGWVAGLASAPEYLWDKFPHVPGLSQVTKDVPPALERTRELEKQLAVRGTALREQARAARAALDQARTARAEAEGLKKTIETAEQDIVILRDRVATAEGEVRRRSAMLEALGAELERARAVPSRRVTTRAEAVEVLRQMGY